jgi:hypothetical protein
MTVHFLRTAGECLCIEYAAGVPVARIAAGYAGEAYDDESAAGMPVSVHLVLESTHAPFRLRAGDRVTRGVWSDGSAVVIEDAGTSGFDLRCEPQGQVLQIRARWVPPARTRLANAALRQRATFLMRAALLHYPIMWWAGTHGRAPLHVSALQLPSAAPALAGPSGVGKSTLVEAELVHQGDGGRARAAGDNLAVCDGRTVYGVVEPRRTLTGKGPRTSHGRRELSFTDRLPSVDPDRVIAVSLSESASVAHLQPLAPEEACRTLVTGTYMAGELRRYWPFAAALTAATGLGPVAPQVELAAHRLTSALPCLSLTLSRRTRTRLSSQLNRIEAPSRQAGLLPGAGHEVVLDDQLVAYGESRGLEP